MTNGGKGKKKASAKSHPEVEARKPNPDKKSRRSSKGHVRLSATEEKERGSKRQSSSDDKSRKSSLNGSFKAKPDEDAIKENDELNDEVSFADDETSEGGHPLAPEKSAEKAKVLKKFLENKYKVEFPKAEVCLEKSAEFQMPPTEKEILARNGVDMDLTKEEQMNMLKLYDKLEEGIAQAEEFFRSIGIEWNSEEEMFKVKPKKFMPAMTMIAFGPDYDDVIVCKDNEETGETQACVLNKENKDCPKDVTAVNLNIYKDGFQAEDEEFNAYTSDSIRDFFLNNIGSYVIMKPDDSTPQTILIRVVDEREKSYEEVRREKAEGVPRRPAKNKAEAQSREPKKRKGEGSGGGGGASGGGASGGGSGGGTVDEPGSSAKYYGRPSAKSAAASETVEIFEKHKIIKRFEDMPTVEDGIGSSSWYWRNQRKPLSSDYVVPPNITTTTLGTDDTRTFEVPSESGPARPRPPPPPETTKTTDEKSTSVTGSLVDGRSGAETRSAWVPVPPAGGLAPPGLVAEAPPTTADPVQRRHDQHSQSRVDKINIYHGPVTVINLGEPSNDSVRISTRPGDKLKVSTRREGRSPQASEASEVWSPRARREWARPDPPDGGPWLDRPDPDAGPTYRFAGLDENYSEGNMYETEYDATYNRGAAQWSDLMAEGARRKSEPEGVDATDSTFQHISLLGQKPPPGQEQPPPRHRPEKKMSVLLDLNNQTVRRESVAGIELNKKTSDTQITVALRDNINGKKYLVNIYPEEQLKRIWSILKLNKIDIQNVTPELVLGNAPGASPKPFKPDAPSRPGAPKDVRSTPSLGRLQEKDGVSSTSADPRGSASGSAGSATGQPPSIQSDAS